MNGATEAMIARFGKPPSASVSATWAGLFMASATRWRFSLALSSGTAIPAAACPAPKMGAIARGVSPPWALLIARLSLTRA